MKSLIVRNGLMTKNAGDEGPSFEQQFGILTNSMIAEKLPSMDNMKLAFQLIEKSDDDTKACGAAVYMIGNSVVFVPSFFKANKIQTGDMMFVAQTQQFLPLSDAWVAWLRDKDLSDPGQLIPREAVGDNSSAKATTIRDIADPITKTAKQQMPELSDKIPGLYVWNETKNTAEDQMSKSANRLAPVFMRGLLYLDPDMQKTASDCGSVLNVALHMGKDVAESMLDNLIKNANFMNSTLTFYSTDAVNTFAKEAAAIEERENTPTVELILPLTKEAKTLNSQELKALHKDGFFIRKVANVYLGKAPDVVRQKNVEGMFRTLNAPGKAGLLTMNGNVTKHKVLALVDTRDGYDCCCGWERGGHWEAPAENYKRPRQMIVITDGEYTELPHDVMHNAQDFEEWKPEMAEGIGKVITNGNFKNVEWHDIVLVPSSGCAYKIPDRCCHEASIYSVAAEDSGLKAPIISEASVVVPFGSRLIKQKGSSEFDRPISVDEAAKKEEKKSPDATTQSPYVTMVTFEVFMGEYLKKNYRKARVYNNGSEFVISGDGASSEPVSLKEAALHLVKEYDIEPAVAKIMLKEASNGATYISPKSQTYFIEKKAEAFEGEYNNPDADIASSKFINQPPQLRQMEMPTILEDPANLEKAVETAAQNGIKEVFDITALKILARQNHFFDEIHDDIPGFMKTIDSLCRKLFQFYWHTDKMEEKYGTVKMKSLEDSLKCTLDSLSDLTIFFKLRTVDGTQSTGDVTGELMTGQML